MDIAAIIIGLVVGGGIGWLIAKLQISKTTSAALVEKEKSKTLSLQVEDLKKALEGEQAKGAGLLARLSAEEANHLGLKTKLEEQKKEWENMREKFTLAFENLAAKIFAASNKEFVTQSRSNLADLLKPLRERITEFEGKIDSVHKDTVAKNAGLFNELKNMRELNLKMSEEARSLTRALKGDAKIQGNWGELVLERVLEKSGLEKDREYFVQKNFTQEDGTRTIPDVVLCLPDQKKMIIDAKVSITAYSQYVNAENEDKAYHLKAHLNSIKKHIEQLSEKNYQNLYEIDSPNFVLMFIPVEPAFAVALNEDSTLYNKAFEKNIVIVTPTTLLATLRTIDTMWNNEKQQRNALEIARQAGALYNKFVGFTDDLQVLGKHLSTSKKYYDNAMNKLSEGKGSLVGKVEALKKLGAKAEKTIDAALLEKVNDERTLFDM